MGGTRRRRSREVGKNQQFSTWRIKVHWTELVLILCIRIRCRVFRFIWPKLLLFGWVWRVSAAYEVLENELCAACVCSRRICSAVVRFLNQLIPNYPSWCFSPCPESRFLYFSWALCVGLFCIRRSRSGFALLLICQNKPQPFVLFLFRRVTDCTEGRGWGGGGHFSGFGACCFRFMSTWSAFTPSCPCSVLFVLRLSMSCSYICFFHFQQVLLTT